MQKTLAPRDGKKCDGTLMVDAKLSNLTHSLPYKPLTKHHKAMSQFTTYSWEFFAQNS